VTIPTCTPKAILLVNGGTAEISSGFGLSDIFTPAGASLLMVGLKDGDDSIVSTASETFLTLTVLAEAD
jgi:hypothetical protein